MMRNVTPLDLQLAGFFYPVLIEVAKEEGTITYGGLRERTKRENPASAEAVDRCTDQSVGRRLEVVRMFTDERGYPDLTSLVLNKDTGEVGRGFVGDPETHRNQVRAFDWENAEPDFNLFVADLKAEVLRKASQVSENEAKKLMAEAGKRKGFRFPSDDERSEILERICAGWDPGEVLFEILGSPKTAGSAEPLPD